MSIIERTVVLTGVHAGKTINLRGIYPFVDGELTLQGDEQDVNCEVKALERNFSAYLRGDPRLEAAAANMEATIKSALVLEQNMSAGEHLANKPHINMKEAVNGISGVQEGAGKSDGQADLSGGALADGAGAPAGDATTDGGVAAAAVDGATGSAPEAGNGQPAELKVSEPKTPGVTVAEPVHEVNEKLKRAVLGLDPKNDTHWTQSGKPSMDAVEKSYGSAGITRADIDAVAPGFRRPA